MAMEHETESQLAQTDQANASADSSRALAELIRSHPKMECDENLKNFVAAGKENSCNLALRLSNAYKCATEHFGGYGDSFWAANEARNAELLRYEIAGSIRSFR